MVGKGKNVNSTRKWSRLCEFPKIGRRLNERNGFRLVQTVIIAN